MSSQLQEIFSQLFYSLFIALVKIRATVNVYKMDVKGKIIQNLPWPHPPKLARIWQISFLQLSLDMYSLWKTIFTNWILPRGLQPISLLNLSPIPVTLVLCHHFSGFVRKIPTEEILSTLNPLQCFSPAWMPQNVVDIHPDWSH